MIVTHILLLSGSGSTFSLGLLRKDDLITSPPAFLPSSTCSIGMGLEATNCRICEAAPITALKSPHILQVGIRVEDCIYLNEDSRAICLTARVGDSPQNHDS